MCDPFSRISLFFQHETRKGNVLRGQDAPCEWKISLCRPRWSSKGLSRRNVVKKHLLIFSGMLIFVVCMWLFVCVCVSAEKKSRPALTYSQGIKGETWNELCRRGKRVQDQTKWFFPLSKRTRRRFVFNRLHVTPLIFTHSFSWSHKSS